MSDDTTIILGAIAELAAGVGRSISENRAEITAMQRQIRRISAQVFGPDELH